jgi:hypothetical protein
LELFCKNKTISYKKNVIGGKFIIFHDFSKRIFPGEFLPAGALRHFNRHACTNPRKIRQEKANFLTKT